MILCQVEELDNILVPLLLRGDLCYAAYILQVYVKVLCELGMLLTEDSFLLILHVFWFARDCLDQQRRCAQPLSGKCCLDLICEVLELRAPAPFYYKQLDAEFCNSMLFMKKTLEKTSQPLHCVHVHLCGDGCAGKTTLGTALSHTLCNPGYSIHVQLESARESES